MDNIYTTHLANPAAIQKYKGLKYSNDSHDDFWLAHLLRLGILPEGYIYPKEDRPIRDLFTKTPPPRATENLSHQQLAGNYQQKLLQQTERQQNQEVQRKPYSSVVAGQEDLELSGEEIY